jgi:hypothetical protein
MLEGGSAMSGHPSLDFVLDPDEAIFGMVDAISPWIDAVSESGFDASPVFRVNA